MYIWCLCGGEESKKVAAVGVVGSMNRRLALASIWLLSFQPCEYSSSWCLYHHRPDQHDRWEDPAAGEHEAQNETEDESRWPRQSLVLLSSQHITRRASSNINRISLYINAFDTRDEKKVIIDTTHPWPPQLLIRPKWSAL